MIARAPAIQPRPTLWRRIDAAGRVAFPALSAAAGLLLLAAPLDLPGQAALRPAYALACVYFWSLHRPAAMPGLAAFGLGLLADLLGAEAIGVVMVGLLTAQSVALGWRRVLMRQEFLIQWLAFCGVALIFAAIIWSFDSLFAGSLLPLAPVLLQAAVAAGCYPVLALLLLVAHGGLAAPEAA